MIKHIFECIKQRILENIPEIKDVRIYNGQDVFSDEHTPFHSPSVFVDFTNIEYETIGYGTQDAEVTLNVMLFHEEFTLNHLEVFELNSELNRYLNLYGEWGATLERTASETDTSFDRLYVMSTEYVTSFTESTFPEGNRIPIGDWSETNLPITGETDWSFEVTGFTTNNEIAFEFDIPYSANTNN